MDIEKLIEDLSCLRVQLHQDTSDTAQLDPLARLRSIHRVWESCKHHLGISPEVQCLDVGCGFGYGLVYLYLVAKIQVLGIEKVGHKIDQAQSLFDQIGINLLRVATPVFSKGMPVYESDFFNVSNDFHAELITMFYLSEELVSRKGVWDLCRRIVGNSGKILLSVQLPVGQVKEWIKCHPVPFKVTYIEIPNNFEQTAIIFE